MGVPQKRERAFFIARRNDLQYPPLKLNFIEPVITYGQLQTGTYDRDLTAWNRRIWECRKPTDNDFASIHERIDGVRKRFNCKFVHADKVPNTIAASPDSIPVRYDSPHRIYDAESKMIGTFPQDYNFKGIGCGYLVGMSVPPVMAAQIANQIWRQWLAKQ